MKKITIELSDFALIHLEIIASSYDKTKEEVLEQITASYLQLMVSGSPEDQKTFFEILDSVAEDPRT